MGKRAFKFQRRKGFITMNTTAQELEMMILGCIRRGLHTTGRLFVETQKFLNIEKKCQYPDEIVKDLLEEALYHLLTTHCKIRRDDNGGDIRWYLVKIS
jgi:hypothetical protein